jgi:hypothetical protein
MIKATATVPGKPPLVILGLSFGNLRKFLAEPRDTYIHVKGSDMGITCDILLCSGETEEKLAEMMMKYVGPETVVHDERPK